MLYVEAGRGGEFDTLPDNVHQGPRQVMLRGENLVPDYWLDLWDRDPNSRYFEPRAEQHPERGFLSSATAATPGSPATSPRSRGGPPNTQLAPALRPLDLYEPLSARLPYLDGHGATLQDVS